MDAIVNGLRLVAAASGAATQMQKSGNVLWKNGRAYCPACGKQVSMKSGRNSCRACGHSLLARAVESSTPDPSPTPRASATAVVTAASLVPPIANQTPEPLLPPALVLIETGETRQIRSSRQLAEVERLGDERSLRIDRARERAEAWAREQAEAELIAAGRDARRQAEIEGNGGYTNLQLYGFGAGIALIPALAIILLVRLAIGGSAEPTPPQPLVAAQPKETPKPAPAQPLKSATPVASASPSALLPESTADQFQPSPPNQRPQTSKATTAMSPPSGPSSVPSAPPASSPPLTSSATPAPASTPPSSPTGSGGRSSSLDLSGQSVPESSPTAEDDRPKGNNTPYGHTATGIPTYLGPRGGVYHYSRSGKKVYEKRRK